jgi:glycosyltransferase involved in cell wall biosynthesis
MSASRIVFVNRYYYPDLSATSQILTDLAVHLAESGMDVTVVTGRQRYTGARVALPARERLRGVHVLRVVTTGFGRVRLAGRAADYLSFYFSAFWQLVKLLRQGDIVIAKTDPPLMSVVAALASRLKGARQVNWLQDLFPEVAAVLEPELLSARIARIAQQLRDWSLRYAEANVVLGELMSCRVLALGLLQDRVVTIPNWADDRAIEPVAHELNPLRAEWDLEGKFVVAYSGNLGRAHEFSTMLEAARLLAKYRDIVILVIGAGARLPEVERFTAEHRLANLLHVPYQPRERLPWSLGVADMHLVSLLPELEGLIVPSKFYGIAAARRATAFIGDADGEIANLLKRHDCGRAFAIGDAAGLAEFIVELYEHPEVCSRMGHNARAALDAEWSQAKAFRQWRGLLAGLQNRDEPSRP